MTEFGKLHEDGSYEYIRTRSQSAIKGCPHFIWAPEHYREDESCRCNDPDHTEMQGWGYKWNGRRWQYNEG